MIPNQGRVVRANDLARTTWHPESAPLPGLSKIGHRLRPALLGPTRMLEAPADVEEGWKKLDAVAACVATKKEKTDVA